MKAFIFNEINTISSSLYHKYTFIPSTHLYPKVFKWYLLVQGIQRVPSYPRVPSRQTYPRGS